MKIATSIWEQETFLKPQDFIIAGGGLVSLWSALEIKRKHPKAKVTILERGSIPTGASTRNAGFACFGSPSEMLHDIEMLGEENMWKIVEMRYNGISKIRKTFKDKQISYDDCSGYECFNLSDNIEQIRDKLPWINKGLKNICSDKNSFSFCDKKLSKFGFKGFAAMVENKHEGGLHSGKLVQALIKKVQAAGVQIFNGLEITGWDDHENDIVINTNKYQFTCNKLILCTNALSAQFLPEHNLKPARGQVLVTSPIKGLKMKGTFHYDKGFYYFRNVGKRILIGGARNSAFEQEETVDMSTTENIQQRLQQFLKDHISTDDSYEITHRWSGIMGLTSSRLPVVEVVSRNVIAAIACNGMGVALSPIIAEKVAALALS